MDGRKILILKKDDEIFFSDRKNVDSLYYYKTGFKKTFFFKCIVKLKLDFLLPFYLDSWRKNIRLYDVIVLFDNGINDCVIKYINKTKKKDAKILVWYWNPIDDRNVKLLDNNAVYRFFTYNLRDSVNYPIKYINQFYNTDLITSLSKGEYKYDLMFIGRDKGRRNTVEKLVGDLGADKKVFLKIFNDFDSGMPYSKYLKYLSDSKALLEINANDANGLTLRALECLFFEKKLITDNKDIRNYDFYNPENIFVLGVDDMSKIDSFLSKPYKKVNKKILSEYTFDHWLEVISTYSS